MSGIRNGSDNRAERVSESKKWAKIGVNTIDYPFPHEFFILFIEIIIKFIKIFILFIFYR